MGVPLVGSNNCSVRVDIKTEIGVNGCTSPGGILIRDITSRHKWRCCDFVGEEGAVSFVVPK